MTLEVFFFFFARLHFKINQHRHRVNHVLTKTERNSKLYKCRPLFIDKIENCFTTVLSENNVKIYYKVIKRRIERVFYGIQVGNVHWPSVCHPLFNSHCSYLNNRLKQSLLNVLTSFSKLFTSFSYLELPKKEWILYFPYETFLYFWTWEIITPSILRGIWEILNKKKKEEKKNSRKSDCSVGVAFCNSLKSTYLWLFTGFFFLPCIFASPEVFQNV